MPLDFPFEPLREGSKQSPCLAHSHHWAQTKNICRQIHIQLTNTPPVIIRNATVPRSRLISNPSSSFSIPIPSTSISAPPHQASKSRHIYFFAFVWFAATIYTKSALKSPYNPRNNIPRKTNVSQSAPSPRRSAASARICNHISSFLTSPPPTRIKLTAAPCSRSP